MILEALLIMSIIFLSFVPHELAHILMFKYYGVSSHLKLSRSAYGRMGVLSIGVIPNDESSLDNLNRKDIGIIAASGGVAGTIFVIVCYLLLSSLLTIVGNMFLIFVIGYNLLYTVWETKFNLNLN